MFPPKTSFQTKSVAKTKITMNAVKMILITTNVDTSDPPGPPKVF